MLPNRPGVVLAKLLRSNQGLPTLMPCKTLIGAIRSGVCELPVALTETEPAPSVKVRGAPVRAVRMPAACHPPKIFEGRPVFRNLWPLPKGTR